ncbi:MAG: RHS repeat-associated core domain-containing protein [Chloroherpetonaceae bacterium]
MNYAARIYDPEIGRFLQADPLWESFPTLSPYQYAFNNPMQYKDPSGLAPEKEKSKINIYKFV